MTTLREWGEAALIAHIRQALPRFRALEVPIGDDGAVYADAAGRRVAVADAMVEDVHFSRAFCPPRDIGYKLVAVNVSDLVAMGADPDTALLTLSLPAALEASFVRALVDGIADACAVLKLTIVGGDVTGSPGPIALSLAATGRLRGEPLLRSAARPDDDVWVTRPLGLAALGLRALRDGLPCDPEAVSAFLRPAVEVEKGRRLSTWDGCGAVMDLSDGLAIDAGRMAAAGGVRFELDVAAIPGPDLGLAVHGGEDYALLFTGRGAPPCDAIRIGRVTRGSGVVFSRDGEPVEVPGAGFDHFGSE